MSLPTLKRKDMKRYLFNDAYRQTVNIISGRQTQYRRPLSEEGVQRLAKYLTNDGTLDGDAVAADFHKFLKRYAPWQVGDQRAIQQTYNEIWRSTLNEEYRYRLQTARGWNNKYVAQSENLLYGFTVERMRLERLSDITDDDAIACGAVQCNDHLTGESLGWWCEGLPPSVYPSPREAYIAAYQKEWCVKGVDVWCWVYELKVEKILEI